jgi:hypothetical protein
MHFSLFFRTDAWILSAILFFGSLVLALLGKYVRNKYFKADAISKDGTSALLGSLFGLWAFILAFTFANSESRFDSVRNVLNDEYVAISNAIYWKDLFPDSIQDTLRSDLRNYLDARIDYFNNVRDYGKFIRARNDAIQIGRSLWTTTVKASFRPNMAQATNNMFAALTAMRNVAARRESLLLSGVPDLIIFMLFLLTFPVGFFCGFTTPVTRHFEWSVILGFLLLATIIFYITLNLGRPMRSLIKPNLGEERLVELRRDI